MQTDAPGLMCRCAPSRGAHIGTSHQCANVPNVPKSSGTSAHSDGSITYTLPESVNVPFNFDVPVGGTSEGDRHIKKQPQRRQDPMAARPDNGLLPSPSNCMRVRGTRRVCHRCGTRPVVLHVPLRVAGTFCPECCPMCGGKVVS